MERPDDLDLMPGEKIGIWYYGETGAGKTYAATTEFPDAYRKIANNKWWDGYQREDHVIMDDFDKSHDYMGYHLKIWADRYAFMVEVKGSAMYIRPKNIVVTSNYHPKEIWENKSTLDPILRRFKVVRFATLANSLFDQDTDEVRHGFDTVPPPVPLLSPPNSGLDLDDIQFEF